MVKLLISTFRAYKKATNSIIERCRNRDLEQYSGSLPESHCTDIETSSAAKTKYDKISLLNEENKRDKPTKPRKNKKEKKRLVGRRFKPGFLNRGPLGIYWGATTRSLFLVFTSLLRQYSKQGATSIESL